MLDALSFRNTDDCAWPRGTRSFRISQIGPARELDAPMAIGGAGFSVTRRSPAAYRHQLGHRVMARPPCGAGHGTCRRNGRASRPRMDGRQPCQPARLAPPGRGSAPRHGQRAVLPRVVGRDRDQTRVQWRVRVLRGPHLEAGAHARSRPPSAVADEVRFLAGIDVLHLCDSEFNLRAGMWPSARTRCGAAWRACGGTGTLRRCSIVSWRRCRAAADHWHRPRGPGMLASLGRATTGRHPVRRRAAAGMPVMLTCC